MVRLVNDATKCFPSSNFKIKKSTKFPKFPQIRLDCNVHLLNSFPCSSDSLPFRTIEPHKLMWSLNPVRQRRCLPPLAQATHLVMPASETRPLSGVRYREKPTVKPLVL